MLLGVGLAALVVQGAAALVLPYPFCPDLGLLVVIAIGLYWEPLPSGFALAALLGYSTDVLSGSLLGQHAMLRLVCFAAARLASRQLNLRGALPFAVFAGGLTIAYAAALEAQLAFFTGAPTEVGAFGRTLLHAVVNAFFAPIVAAVVEQVCSWGGDDDRARRPVRFDGGDIR